MLRSTLVMLNWAASTARLLLYFMIPKVAANRSSNGCKLRLKLRQAFCLTFAAMSDKM